MKHPKSFTIGLWLASIFTAVSSQDAQCKCYQGDDCWPTADSWTDLNTTVGGNLHKVIPPGAPCYKTFDGKPTYDQAQCTNVTSSFTDPTFQSTQPATPLFPIWSNNTCLPSPTARNSTCLLGYTPPYALLAHSAADIAAGVDFARTHNLRLVIRNTGSDLAGRSQGYGALAINTHALQDVTFVGEYAGPGGWTGGAVTVGAGVQTGRLYEAAFAEEPKVVVVGGGDPTVGIAGGFLAGGGHGPLSSAYGLAADNALAFGVVTAAGDVVTANADENPDLFWALKGGGGSSYGVVYEATLKTFPEVPTAGTIMDIKMNDTTYFWRGVRLWHNLAISYTDQGIYQAFELVQGSLHVQPIVGPNMTKSQLDYALGEMFAELAVNGVIATHTTTEYPTFFEMYSDLFKDSWAGFDGMVGGWVFSRDDLTVNNDGVMAAYRSILAPNASSNAVSIRGYAVGPGVAVPTADNAVHPGWRNATVAMAVTYDLPDSSTPSQRQVAANQITTVLDEQARNASTSGLSYINEGDMNEPNWQSVYWGDNYSRLKDIKTKWDPAGVFYAKTMPGTEDWSVNDDGMRLCKTT